MLYHRQWGKTSNEPIVVIHGLFGSIENLGMITRLLKDEYSVFAIDLPNHGRSSPIEICSLPSMAAAVVEWMDTVNLTQAHFLGHSLGGKVSMEIALRFPERVSKLIVADIAPVDYVRRHDDVFAGFYAVDLATIQNRGDADHAMKAHVAEASTRSFLLKNLERIDGHWQWRIHLDGLHKDYDHCIKGNSTEFPPFDQPVLFIKGEHSPYIQSQHREQILSLFPRAAVKIIHDTEHWLHAEKPDIFAGITKRFLSK